MSETPAGRRGNGLQASDWGALVDLDPRLVEAMLDQLAGAGVAAYVEPASAADPFSRASLPSRPLDRLWVDAGRADLAREVVAAEVADLTRLLREGDPTSSAHGLVQPVPRHAARRVLTPPTLPEPPPRPAPVPAPAPAPAPAAEEAEPVADPSPGRGDRDPDADDEVFRQIVAGFDTAPTDPIPRWPATEDLGGDLDALRRGPPPVDRAPRRRRDDAALPSWVEPEALEPEPEAEDPELDHYVPPPPPPVPRVHVRTVGAVLLLVLGLVVLFFPGLLRQAETPGTILLGVVLLAGGAAALVHRVRDTPPPDSGPGDGAVV